jgi:hypothetical protein
MMIVNINGCPRNFEIEKMAGAELQKSKAAIEAYVAKVSLAVRKQFDGNDASNSGNFDLMTEATVLLEQLFSDNLTVVQQTAWSDLVVTLHGTLSTHKITDSIHLLDCLLALEPTEKLQDRISRVCEQWISRKWPNHDQLVAQVVPYLLMRTLEQNSKAVDIKRLHALVPALSQFDLMDASSESLANLILLTFSHPLFLRTSDGHKTLCDFMLFDQALTKRIHSYVKTIVCRYLNSQNL